MPNDRYQTIMKANVFKNQDRWDGSTPMERGKPNWSNTAVTLHAAIPAGTYSLSMWSYADSGNVSLEFSKDTQAQEAAPQPQGATDDDFAI